MEEATTSITVAWNIVYTYYMECDTPWPKALAWLKENYEKRPQGIVDTEWIKNGGLIEE